MADYDPDYESPLFDDGLQMARAEIDMMRVLSKDQ